MARTKQTSKRAVGQHRMLRARFATLDDDATPSTSGTAPNTSGSAAQASKVATIDTGGKQP